MNFNKAFYLLGEYTDNRRNIQGGVAQIPPDKMGDAVRTIASEYGCETVVMGFIDPRTLTDSELAFRECADAAGLQIVPNCPLAGNVGPTLSQAHDPAWYNARYTAWSEWWIANGLNVGIIDFEFYRNHAYAKMRNVNRTPEFIAAFRSMMLGIAWSTEWGWAFGGQNSGKLGYAFIDICQNAIGTDTEYDASAGAWRDDAHTIPANPAPDKFPPWFPKGKLVHSRRWCSRNGDWVKPGSVWQKTWTFSGAPDGVCYSTDDQLLANLGL